MHSTYQVARRLMLMEDEMASSSTESYGTKFWKHIWEANVPPRVRHFIWWVAQNILPTKYRLITGGVDGNLLGCVFCDKTEESAFHVLLVPLRSLCGLPVHWAFGFMKGLNQAWSACWTVFDLILAQILLLSKLWFYGGPLEREKCSRVASSLLWVTILWKLLTWRWISSWSITISVLLPSLLTAGVWSDGKNLSLVQLESMLMGPLVRTLP